MTLNEPHFDASTATPHGLFDMVADLRPPEHWLQAAHELEERAEERDRLRVMLRNVVFDFHELVCGVDHKRCECSMALAYTYLQETGVDV